MIYQDEAELLRQQGHRLTPQRLKILQVIRTNGQHMTAEDIHAAIVPQQPYLDIATVYRTLQWLQSVDLVASIDLGDGKLRYEYRPRGEYHHHLVCQHCGTHIQIPDTYLASLKHEIEHEYGFLLDANHLALPGSCAVCAAGNAITKNRTR